MNDEKEKPEMKDNENEDNAKEDEPPSIKELWSDFGSSASVHGFPFAFSARGICKTAMWVFVSFLCLGLLLYVIAELTIIFFTYPVNVKKQWLHATEVTFPAVTVCNTNPVKQSLLHLSAEVSALDSRRRRRRREAGEGDLAPLRYRRSVAEAPCTTSLHSGTNTCYWVENDATYNNDDARALCEAGGGWLAYIKTQAAHDFLVAEGLIGAEELWIGVARNVDGDLEWRDGSSFSWTNWAGSSSASNGDCVNIDTSGGWSVNQCDHNNFQFGAICEKGDGITNVPAATTEALTTVVHTTAVAPTTSAPTTVAPTTSAPTTVAPTTSSPITLAPTTAVPSAAAVTTAEAITAAETTYDETTAAETTAAVTTPRPTSIFEDREPLREDFLQETEFLEALADTPEEVKQQMGYQQREFVLQCKYAGRHCQDSDFETFFNSMHGNCYTFNADWHPDSRGAYSTSRPGASAGLELMLNINQAEYLLNNDLGAGAIVVIHPASRMPFPEDEGSYARPGVVTSFEIRETSVERLPAPYSKCIVGAKSQKDINVFEERLPVQYSSPACFKTCYQKYIIEECGCADPMFPQQGKAFGNFAGRSCDIRNATLDDCMYGVELRYIRNELKCDCKQVCSDLFYPASSSIAQWPSQVELERVASYLENEHNISVTNDSESFISKNIVKIRVYFRELNTEQTIQLPKYTEGKLLTSFAGSIGLFLGCTVFSVLEPFVLIFDIIVTLCRKAKNRNNDKKEKSFDDIGTLRRMSATSTDRRIAWH